MAVYFDEFNKAWDEIMQELKNMANPIESQQHALARLTRDELEYMVMLLSVDAIVVDQFLPEGIKVMSRGLFYKMCGIDIVKARAINDKYRKFLDEEMGLPNPENN